MSSIGAPSRHWWADRKSKMAASATILKINFWHLFPNFWSIWAKICSVATGQLLDGNDLKSCWSEIQDGYRIENLFWTSPKPPRELSWNLQCSNRLMCRWKIAKIVPIGNPKWPLSWKPIFYFSIQTVGPFELKHTVATGWPLDQK